MMTSNRVTIGISNISISFFRLFSGNLNILHRSNAVFFFFFYKIQTIYNPNKSTFKRNTCYCDFRFNAHNQQMRVRFGYFGRFLVGKGVDIEFTS